MLGLFYFLLAAISSINAAVHVRNRSWGWATFSALWVVICTGLMVSYKVAA